MKLLLNVKKFLRLWIFGLTVLISQVCIGNEFFVTSTSDYVDTSLSANDCITNIPDSRCTLRAAIERMNSGQGGNIYLAEGEYILTQGELNIDANIGLSPINRALADETLVKIRGTGTVNSNRHRIFNVRSNKTFVIGFVTLENGWTETNQKGGAIHLEGSSTLHAINVNFEKNHTFGDAGGAIYVGKYASAVIRGCIFNENGDFFMDGDNEPQHNGDHHRNRGGAVFAAYATNVLISQSVFTKNKASRGGALFVSWGSKVDIENSSFNDNSTHREIFGNISTTGQGAAIYAEGGVIRINHSSINKLEQAAPVGEKAIFMHGSMDWSQYTANEDDGKDEFDRLCKSCHLLGNEPFDISKFTINTLKDRIRHTMYALGKCDEQCSVDVATYIATDLCNNNSEVPCVSPAGSIDLEERQSLTIANSIVSGGSSSITDFNACGSRGRLLTSAGGNVLSNWAYSVYENDIESCSLWGFDNSDLLTQWRYIPFSGTAIDLINGDVIEFDNNIFVAPEALSFHGTPTALPTDINSGWRGNAIDSNLDAFFSCPSRDQTGFSRDETQCDSGAYEWR